MMSARHNLRTPANVVRHMPIHNADVDTDSRKLIYAGEWDGLSASQKKNHT